MSNEQFDKRHTLYAAAEGILLSIVKSGTDRDGSWVAIKQSAIDLLRNAVADMHRPDTLSAEQRKADYHEGYQDALNDASSAPSTERASLKAPMPTDEEYEAALRQEYGGTPTSDTLIDLWMRDRRELRAAPNAVASTPELIGEWGRNDPRRAFVDGAKWWEHKKTGGTMWPSDVTIAENLAFERYPDAARSSTASPTLDDLGVLCMQVAALEQQFAYYRNNEAKMVDVMTCIRAIDFGKLLAVLQNAPVSATAQPTFKPTHVHAEGGTYRHVADGFYKDLDSDWVKAVIYVDAKGRYWATSLNRWVDRFESMPLGTTERRSDGKA